MPLAKAIEGRSGELALRKGGIAAKNPVAGVRILERLELIPATITDLHQPQLQAMGKMPKAEDKPGVWVTMADFQTFAEHTTGILGMGQGFFCGRYDGHTEPEGLPCRRPALGMAGTQDLDGVFGLQSGQRAVCAAHTALLGEMAAVAVRTPEAPPPRRRPSSARGDRHTAEATAGDVQGNRVQPHRVAPVEAAGSGMLPSAGWITAGPHHMG